MPSLEHYKWSVSVFARNERHHLPACIKAIARAIRGVNTHVSLILNGTSDDSSTVADALTRQLGLSIEIYDIEFGDKSNAFNQFVYSIRPKADVYFFVDGYAMVDEFAFIELNRSLEEHSQSNAAAALPSTGRSASNIRVDMLKYGGLHGSLFALRRSFVDRLVMMELRLPIGLYRGDGLIGSFVAHDLDPQNPWRPFLAGNVVPTATWQTVPLSVWRWRDLVRHWHRLIRQGRGRLEHEAIKEIIYRNGYKALPVYADLMILEWINKLPKYRRSKLIRDPFAMLAVWQIRRPRSPATEEIIPHLLAQTPAPV